MKQQLLTMLDMQDAMNRRVTENWREQNYEWYRAIWIECGELLDHYGWKWWKKQQPDMEQVTLELIDIWHFGLSILLSHGDSPEAIAQSVAQQLDIRTDEEDFRLDLERFAADTLNTRDFNVAAFARLMAGAGLSFEQLYASYVGKNVLNFFRQDNGYKEGTYVKIWAGREDNEHLAEIVATLDTTRADFRDAVYAELDKRYTG